VRVFVAGEGPDDIGDWARDPAYHPAHFGGVVESLLRNVRGDGWEIVGGCPWRRIRKFKVGRGLHDYEVRNVLRAAGEAAELGCDMIAFVRDRDGDPEREVAIEEGIHQATGRGVISTVVGGVAIEATDAWILALLGESNSEHVRDPKRQLEDKHGINRAAQKADVAASTHLDNVPDDATSLRRWINRARQALGRGDGASSYEQK
jgi:hypothetical protein